MSGPLYVAPDGSDHGSGRFPERSSRSSGSDEGPLATLARAVQVARETMRTHPTEATRRIVLRGGRYHDTSVELCPEDSGLSIEAMPGERPVLLGGRRIIGWEPEPDGRFWFAPLPGARQRAWDPRLIVVNGRYCSRSRLPETGTFEHENEFNVRWLSTTQGGWERTLTERELTTLTWRAGDLGTWVDPLNAELTIFHKWDESLVGAASCDAARRTIELASPCGHPPGAFGSRRYAVGNLRQGMLRPGQWYLDRRAGTVVYWPLPDEDMREAIVLAPRADSVLSFRGAVRDVTVRDISMTLANAPLQAAGFGAMDAPAAIRAFDGLAGCIFSTIEIENTGGSGIRIDGPCSNVRIQGCRIAATGAGGIHLDARSARGSTCPGTDCVIEENRVLRVGLVHSSAIGIACRGCLVRGNEITDAPYTGICCGGGSPRIEGNVVRRVMQELNDGAAIYLTSCAAATVRENIVSDIWQSGATDSIRNGIYLDEQCREVLVERNLVVSCSHPQFNHMTSGNVVRGNVFVSDDTLQVSFIRCSEYRFEDNVLFARGKLIFAGREGAITVRGGNILHSQTGDYEEHVIGEDYRCREVRPLVLQAAPPVRPISPPR